MSSTLLSAVDRVAQPWKDGGGCTSTVAVFPPHAGLDNFDWRIGQATVAHPGKFSRFAGIDRTLAVIDGRLRLEFDDKRSPVDLSCQIYPLSFPGELSVCGTLVGGDAADLNLMTRRVRFAGSIERIASPSSRS